MPELILHILDLVENSVSAGAKEVSVEVEADQKADSLTIVVEDDGCGMSKEQERKSENPFFTTRTTRQTGFGVPFCSQAAKSTGGRFYIESEKGYGTKIKAVFGLSHIDRAPLGDINALVCDLISSYEEIEFRYRYSFNGNGFEFDTRKAKDILQIISLREPEVLKTIKNFLDDNKNEADEGADIRI